MGEQDPPSDSCGDGGDPKFQIVENSPEETKQIRIESAETGVDCISKLPDSLIVQIISLLTVTEAFRTSILSKRWQHLWTFIDNIIFNRDIRWGSTKMVEMNEFISFTDNVMRLHSCSNIRRFDLSFKCYLDAFICSKTDNWLEIALSKKVKNLYLELWPYYKERLYPKKIDKESYALPQVLCNSDSLLKLHCKYCRFSDDCVLNWTSLKSLKLEYFFIGEEHIEQLSSSCPQLESLELHDFFGLRRLHLTSPKCRRLQLTNHRHPIEEPPLGDDQGCWLEIVAPYVQHLKLSGIFYGMKIRLDNLSCVVHADLNFGWNNIVWEIDDFKDLLASVRCASELTFPSWFIEVHPIVKLIHGGAVDIDFLGDHILSLHKDIVKGSFLNLKTAKVILVRCALKLYRDGTTGLAQFLEDLLENAINLEKLVIENLIGNTHSTRITEMIENLKSFPKASNSAVVSIEPDFSILG